MARTRLVFGLAIALAVLLPSGGRSSFAAAAVPTGTYETYSPLTESPVGPIASTDASRLLGRWLEVTTSAATTTVVFAPERHLRWTLAYGPYGLTRKESTVDGARWTVSTFGYSAQGHLATKRVTGHFNASFTYVTDPNGLVLERRRTGTSEHWVVARQASGAVAETWDGPSLMRRDRFDAAGRLLRTEVPLNTTPPQTLAALRYQRAANGTLLSVTRVIPGKPDRPADPSKRENDLPPKLLGRIATAHAFERYEVLLVAGRPVTHSVSDTGVARKTTDGYDDQCSAMNETSTLLFDAADLATDGRADCICGFCVAMETPTIAGDVLGTDEHFTRGPWVRLDDLVDVTPDHRVMTRTGPRPAGELVVGDLVVGDDGAPRALRSVIVVGVSTDERRGVNVRTRSGTFSASGFRFESETVCSKR
jgi:hypothetical protein